MFLARMGVFVLCLRDLGTSSCFFCTTRRLLSQLRSRQDPSILDVYGVTKNGPADGKDNGDVSGRVFPVFRGGLWPRLSAIH